MFFNMKIEVNEDQPLDDIVSELESKGYCFDGRLDGSDLLEVVTYACDKSYVIFTKYGKNHFMVEHPLHKKTTLAELKEMRCSN